MTRDDIKVGMQFGNLTVIEPIAMVENEKNPGHYLSKFKCRCSCEDHTELYVSPSPLIKGLITSCGCKKKGAINVGMTSGSLEVIEVIGMKMYAGQKQRFCKCRCNICGSVKEYLATAIVQKKFNSCGCQWRKEVNVGDKYESLTVIETNVRQREDGCHIIRCRCDCPEHNEIEMTVSDWNQHRHRSCGCCDHEMWAAKDVPVGRYGHLEVIETGLSEPTGKRYALCRCDCNPNRIFKMGQIELRKGAKSCGCRGRVANGDRFGRLVVIDNSLSNEKNEAMAKCRCDCGKIVEVSQHALKKGTTASCGCGKMDAITIHGESHSRLYRIWKGIHTRCDNDNLPCGKWYKDKGIGYVEEWKDFVKFRDWAMVNGYSDDLTIDRIDGNKGYSPENCRWVSSKAQSNNKSDNVNITYNGKMQTLAQWAEELGITESLIRCRIRAGWTPEETFTIPSRKLGGWKSRKSLRRESEQTS